MVAEVAEEVVGEDVAEAGDFNPVYRERFAEFD